MSRLTIKRLKEVLEYNPNTGFFKWKIGGHGRFPSSIAGCDKSSHGYICIQIDNNKYLAHRLVWFYMTGVWPEKQIDHKNGNITDNRWGNLRAANATLNGRNRSRQNNNKSGFKGVHFVKSKNLFRATIKYNRKIHHLGYFDNPQEAYTSYCLAAIKHHGKFARTV